MLYALVVAFVFGLLRWPVWSITLVALHAFAIDKWMGSPWWIGEYGTHRNPPFARVVEFLLIVILACVIGYSVGRLIAYVMGWLGRNFRTPME